MIENDWPEEDCTLELSVSLGRRYNEPSTWVQHYEGSVIGGERGDRRFGDVSLYVAELASARRQGVHPLEVLDSVNAAVAHFCDLVTPGAGVYRRQLQRISGDVLGSLLIVDRIVLDRKFRGRRLGLEVIEIACQRFEWCSLVALKAFPVQWEGRADEGPARFARDQKRLVAYYNQAGFQAIAAGGLMARRGGAC